MENGVDLWEDMCGTDIGDGVYFVDVLGNLFKHRQIK